MTDLINRSDDILGGTPVFARTSRACANVV